MVLWPSSVAFTLTGRRAVRMMAAAMSAVCVNDTFIKVKLNTHNTLLLARLSIQHSVAAAERIALSANDAAAHRPSNHGSETITEADSTLTRTAIG